MASRISASRALPPERRFFAVMAVLIVASIVIGFAPSYFLRGWVSFGRPIPSFTPMLHLHGVIFTGWMLLFLAQVLLVTRGRRDIHRKLGIIAVALLPVMMIVAAWTGLLQVQRASAPPFTSPLNWLTVPLLGVPVFGGLILAALAKRHDPASHKRYMLIAMVEMSTPGLGRWPWPLFIPPPIILFGFGDLFLLALIAWDLKQYGRLHRATVIGGTILIGSQILRIALWDSESWLGFARWATAWVA